MSEQESVEQDEHAPSEAKRADMPGALRGQVWLTLQTHQAMQLLRGRNVRRDKPAIIGLVHFAERLRLIWQAAGNDDPWADWWLIRIHESIEASARYLGARQAELESLLARDPAMHVTVADSKRPTRVPLQFANPYAYRGARLLSQYDTIVCTVLTARRVGLLDSESSNQLIRNCGHKLRSSFTLVHDYHYTGVNRHLLDCGDAKGEAARAAMGEVPVEIVRGEQRPPLVPRKVNLLSDYAQHIKLHPSALTKTAADEQKRDP